MRRLWAAGAAIVLGLAIGATPVAAQQTLLPGSPATVTQECENINATPIVCAWAASDPRLTGALTHEWVGRAASFGWAPATLEGPEGDWTGHLYAVWTEPAQLFVFLSGDGAYEGWQYAASTIDDGVKMGDSEWVGSMYKGEPPPFGPLVPPTE